MNKNFRNSMYSGPAVDICRPYDFAEFVNYDLTKFLENLGRDPDFVEEGLDHDKVMYTNYNFGGKFGLELEFNSDTQESEITFIGEDPIRAAISNFFSLYRDALKRVN